jgi:hypothetical protein
LAFGRERQSGELQLSAGHSAADAAARYALEAEQARFVSETALEMHRKYAAAAKSETRLARLLEPLESQGFYVLDDRLWPGSSRANVDFVLVGPTGVFIVDAKAWRDVSVHGNRVYQGQDDVTERFSDISSLADLTSSALAELGIAPGEVHVVAVFMGAHNLRGQVGIVDLVSEDQAVDTLLRPGSRLATSEVDGARKVLESLFAEYPRAFQTFELTLPDPVLPLTLEEALISVEEIEASLLAGILAEPIESWMAFLHPDQAKLVRRSFNGPSRIRGAAGTGKTVVGLHRAAHLARTRPGKVLVTTFVRTLPAVLDSLLDRMAPSAKGKIEFAGVHQFALSVLRERGVSVRIDPKRSGQIFNQLWARVGRLSVLARIDPRKDYWEEEVVSVIKGRGLTHFDQYATLARVGRRRALNVEARHAVWQLYSEYTRELRAAGISDYADVILLAEKTIRAKPLEGYSAVIADEAQDLTCAMIRMFHALVGDAPDGLTLIGDGQQTIYPGGYTLAEAGVSIAGRGVVMNRNYRNTVEIADLASSLVLGDDFDDIEGADGLRTVPCDVVRHGARPKMTRFSSRANHDSSLIEHVKSLLSGGTQEGDIGILAQTNYVADSVIKLLASAGIPSVDLHNWNGRTAGAIKVGTIKRAKGLEFKQVLLAQAPGKLLEPLSEKSEAAIVERRELDRRELYVAMTRARDGLWVGLA